MDNRVKIIAVDPPYAIPGGEITVECEGFRIDPASADGVYIEGMKCRIVAASTRRILAIVPDEIAESKTTIHLESFGAVSNKIEITMGRLLTDGMHIVANPAVDPSDDALMLTRSGGRGQHLRQLSGLDP